MGRRLLLGCGRLGILGLRRRGVEDQEKRRRQAEGSRLEEESGVCGCHVGPIQCESSARVKQVSGRCLQKIGRSGNGWRVGSAIARDSPAIGGSLVKVGHAARAVPTTRLITPRVQPGKLRGHRCRLIATASAGGAASNATSTQAASRPKLGSATAATTGAAKAAAKRSMA